MEWDRLVQIAEEGSGLNEAELLTSGKQPRKSKHRSGLAYAGRRFGHMTLSELSNRLEISPSGVSRMIKRCEQDHDEIKQRWVQQLGETPS